MQTYQFPIPTQPTSMFWTSWAFHRYLLSTCWEMGNERVTTSLRAPSPGELSVLTAQHCLLDSSSQMAHRELQLSRHRVNRLSFHPNLSPSTPRPTTEIQGLSLASLPLTFQSHPPNIKSWWFYFLKVLNPFLSPSCPTCIISSVFWLGTLQYISQGTWIDFSETEESENRRASRAVWNTFWLSWVGREMSWSRKEGEENSLPITT